MPAPTAGSWARSSALALLLTSAATSPLLAQTAAPAAPAPVTHRQQVDLVETLKRLEPTVKAQGLTKDFPRLSDAELRRAQAGELVIREIPTNTPVPKTTVASVLPYPVEAVYLVLADPSAHVRFIPELDHSVVLAQTQAGMVWEAFQFMTVPYPAQNRGWVTRMEKNKRLYESTQGMYWEISWRMEEDRYQAFVKSALTNGPEATKLPAALSPDTLEDATTPVFGRGSWVLIPLSDSTTYVEYNSFTDPNANMVERGVSEVLATRIQQGMFKAIAPLAEAYAEGRVRTTNVRVDMQGQSSRALLDQLKALSTSPTTGR